MYVFQLVTNGSESAYVDSNRESKEECKIDRHPSLSTRSPGDVRVTCDVVVAPLVQLLLIMDPRVGIGERYQ